MRDSRPDGGDYRLVDGIAQSVNTAVLDCDTGQALTLGNSAPTPHRHAMAHIPLVPATWHTA